VKAIYALTPEQHATVLSALRRYAIALYKGHMPDLIATNDDIVTPLTAEQTDALCEDLNNHGLSFGDVVNILGTDDSPYVAAAHEHRLLNEGTLEVDPKTIVSESEGGAYVMAWLWVDGEDAGVTSDEESDE
jgi:hypothetical protein